MANFNKNQPGGMTAAAGYMQYRDTLQTPIFSDMIIGRVYKDSVVPLVTTGNFLRGLQECGSTIGFKVEQKIKVHDYQENQTLDQQALETCWRFLTINKAKYFNIKIDRVTKMQICDFKEMTSGFCSNAAKAIKQKLDPEILIEMARCADKANRGANAGPQADFNFGRHSAPFTITPYNLAMKLQEAEILFTDQCEGSYWEDGKMVVIMPNVAKQIFVHRDSGFSAANPQACCGPSQQTIPSSWLGWDIVFSNNVPRVKVDNEYVYYVIFAHSDATGFVQQIEMCEVKEDNLSFGEYYRGLWVYGNATLIPEGIAVGFFKFDASDAT